MASPRAPSSAASSWPTMSRRRARRWPTAFCTSISCVRSRKRRSRGASPSARSRGRERRHRRSSLIRTRVKDRAPPERGPVSFRGARPNAAECRFGGQGFRPEFRPMARILLHGVREDSPASTLREWKARLRHAPKRKSQGQALYWFQTPDDARPGRLAQRRTREKSRTSSRDRPLIGRLRRRCADSRSPCKDGIAVAGLHPDDACRPVPGDAEAPRHGPGPGRLSESWGWASRAGSSMACFRPRGVIGQVIWGRGPPGR